MKNKLLSIISILIILISGIVITPNAKAEIPSLCEALDNCEIEWTSPNDQFYGQTDTYHYGGDSAESQQGGNLLTTISDNNGKLSFYWKISSDYGTLNFEIKNTDADETIFSETINDLKDWEKVEFTISEPGNYRIWWFFNPHPDHPGKAWVDKVEFTEISSENNPPEIPTIDGRNEAFTKFGIIFDANSTDIDQDKIYYEFDWDDGTTSEWLGPSDSGNACPGIHYWNQEGVYQIRARAKDEHGSISDWSEAFEISLTDIQNENNPPFKPSTPEGDVQGIVGEKLSFSATAIDPDADNIVYFWDMDGNQEFHEITDERNIITSFVDYTWYKAGSYDISVVAADQNGEAGPRSDTLTVNIDPSEEEFPPVKPVLSGTDESFEGDEIFLTAMSYDVNDEDIRYIWDFDDGSEWHQTNFFDSGTSSTVSHIWDHQGIYDVRVKVENINGEESSWSDLKTVEVKKNKYSTSFYPVNELNNINGKKFSDYKTRTDLFCFGLPIEELTHKLESYGDEKTGLIGTFAYTFSYVFMLASNSLTTSEACQRIDFYVGREKDVFIEVDITQMNGVHSMLGGTSYNKKVLHIDDFDDNSKKFQIQFGENDLLEKGIELTLFSLLYGASTYTEITKIREIVDSFIYWKETAKDSFFYQRIMNGLKSRVSRTVKILLKKCLK